MSSRKLLISLTPVLAAAAFALVPSTAMAVKPSKPCTTNVLCSGNEGTEALRDDLVEPPKGSSGGGYGTSVLAVNTAGSLRYKIYIAKTAFLNEISAGRIFFGIKLGENPKSKAGECPEAKGMVTFADVQDGSTEGNSSPVYDNVVKPWPVSVRSDHCTTHPGEVTIEGVGLFIPALKNEVATGTLTGTYVQPSTTEKPTKCLGGGVELSVMQPGIVLSLGEAKSFELDNGEEGKPAFICFVAANNYLFPKTAPTWAPFEDFNGSEKSGIWED